MPIKIYKSSSFEELDFLAEDNFDLSSQIAILENWLIQNKKKFEPTRYVADVGFFVGKDAAGGGAIITSKLSGLLSELNVEVHLSEYPQS